MGNILFVDGQGNAIHSCAVCKDMLSDEGEKIKIDDTEYVVSSVEKVIKNGNLSYKITLR